MDRIMGRLNTLIAYKRILANEPNAVDGGRCWMYDANETNKKASRLANIRRDMPYSGDNWVGRFWARNIVW